MVDSEFIFRVLIVSVAAVSASFIWYTILFYPTDHVAISDKSKIGTFFTKKSYFLGELFISIIISSTFILFMEYTGFTGYKLAFFIWIGFVLPIFIKSLIASETNKNRLFILIDSCHYLFMFLVIASVVALL